MSFSAFDREKRMLVIEILSALSVIVAILLASDKSFFPPSFIINFFIWIGHLFQWLVGVIFSLVGLFFRFIEKLLMRDSEAELAPIEEFSAPPLPEPEKGAPWPVWKWLKYGAIVLAAAGFIWFMISPLLNRGKGSPEKLTFFQKLRRIIAEWLRGVLTGLVSFVAFIKSGKASLKLRRPGADEIRQAAKTILDAYSQAQKKDVRRSATLFARLIIWGGEVRHVIWKPVYAPGEYCGILASAALAATAAIDETLTDVIQDTNVTQNTDIIQDTDVILNNKTILRRRNEGIIRCGELFEQALYSAQTRCDAEQKEFKDLIEEITGA
jgi:hypothetical protein